jgi:hypothetical protein
MLHDRVRDSGCVCVHGAQCNQSIEPVAPNGTVWQLLAGMVENGGNWQKWSKMNSSPVAVPAQAG